MSNHYQTLEIESTVTADEIKAAYRKLALKYHPDRNADSPQAAEKFRAVATAYETLGDANKRTQYDFLHGSRSSHQEIYNPSQSAQYRQYRSSGGLEFAEEFFSRFMAEAKRASDEMKRQEEEKKANVVISESFTLEEVAQGSINRIIEYKKEVLCDFCQGKKCSHCKEKGTIIIPAHVITNFPPGAKHGEAFVMKNQGSVSLKTKKVGDLVINIEVKKHPLFTTKYTGALDIHYTLKINLLDLLITDKFKVPTVYGTEEEIEITAIEALHYDYENVISGMGIPAFGGKDIKGNMIVDVEIVIPAIKRSKNSAIVKMIDKLKKLYAKSSD